MSDFDPRVEEIEILIEETISKKSSINEILMFDEEESEDRKTSGIYQ